MYSSVYTKAIQNDIMFYTKGDNLMAVKSANVMARVEPDIKTKAEAIMANLGLPASVVINALYHQVIYNNGIPFPLVIPNKLPSLEDMSKEDFDLMLQESYDQAMRGEGTPFEQVLNDVKNKIK